MARSMVPVIRFTRAGSVVDDAVAGDVTNGNTMTNDGATGLLVINTGTTTAHSVTFNLFRTVDGQAAAPRVVSIAVGESRAFGPFAVGDYGSDLSVNVDHAELTLQGFSV
ncbi:hypothetical protein [Streptomyces lydicus]|uniref:hypothetical protein n=1 Tax=Streptomyces lydicus TaxID=47763 RepID=UPI0036E6283A